MCGARSEPVVDHQLEGPREQEVADQEAGEARPRSDARPPCRGEAASRRPHRPCSNVAVWMNSTAAASFQARVVAGAASPAPGGGDGQQRPQPLTAGGDQVIGQGRNHRHRAVQPFGNQRIHAGHIDLGQTHQGLNRTLGGVDYGLDCIQRLWLLVLSARVGPGICDGRPTAIVARDNGGGIGQGQGKHKARCTVATDQAPSQAQISDDQVLGGRVKLRQWRQGYRSGLDAALLAAACDSTAGQRVLDAGCGVGGALIAAAARRPESRFTGVERDPDARALAAENVALNGLGERVEIVAGDVGQGFRALGLTVFDAAMAR